MESGDDGRQHEERHVALQLLAQYASDLQERVGSFDGKHFLFCLLFLVCGSNVRVYTNAQD